MFLKNIKLTNFRCLKDLELSFEKPDGKIRSLTLILGENGTGKSALLKAIAMITAGGNALAELLRDSDTWIQNGKKSCRVEATLVTQKGDERQLDIKINRNDHIKDVLKRCEDTLEEIDSAIEHTDRNYFIVGFGASRRISRDESISNVKSGNSNRNRYSNIATLFNPNAALNPLESWAMDLHYRKGKRGLKAVNMALDHFLGGVKFLKIDKRKKQLIFQTEDGEIPLDDLSDGYQNVAVWVGDLLYRITSTFKDYKSPLNARGVLLIDEVDLHLHPKWQRTLISFLKNKLPNFQIIATTHSSLTAQQADEGELFSLTRDKRKRISIVPFKGSPKNLLVNQLLTTPMFGLDTTESLDIEEKKKLFIRLKEKKRLTKADKVLFAKTKKILEELPERGYTSKLQKRQMGLLNKIEKKLIKQRDVI